MHEDDIKMMREKAKEDLKNNPLLRLNLGELVNEMHKLAVLDPNIIKNKVPIESMRNYEKYQKLILELNRREIEYTSYKSPTKY